ncbi:uncharacterized protein LOC141909219 [Tubulanus polymorphus]|uniref:uncharacterized protein LOC141909219 n=1 Tax=Tubulanus polymorphus TaxID=672921 RepID=UPI003DA308F4
MASFTCYGFLAIFLIFLSFTDIRGSTNGVDNTQKSCTFFGPGRFSSPESSLINCSWYASNSCCKRTEVTSVFSGMYPLHKASKSCANKLNYMMCYFCSPEQHLWYRKKAHVCAEFCRSLYEDCRGAEYKKIEIAKIYASGEEFCDAQDFIVVEGKHGCFNFDPTPFGRSAALHASTVVVVLSFVTLILHVCSQRLSFGT